MKSISSVSPVAVALWFVTLAWAQNATNNEHASTAENRWAAISKCAAIPDADARHVCTDEFLRKAGLLPGDGGCAIEDSRTFRPSRSATPSPEDSEDQLEVTLATVDKTPDGKLLLRTTDGAIWRQVQSESVRPAPVQGQAMIIEKAGLGGFMCKPSKWVAFRCYGDRSNGTSPGQSHPQHWLPRG